MHEPGCEYFAPGGAVLPSSPPVLNLPPPLEDPKFELGHAAVHHGLTGLLGNVGHAKIADPDKSRRVLQEAKDHWSRMQNPIEGLEEPKKTMGVRLARHVSQGNHADAAELMHGHPMLGSVPKGTLAPIIEKLSHSVMNQDPDPEALKSSAEYLHSSVKGHAALDDHMRDLLGAHKGETLKPDHKARAALKEKMDDYMANPEKMLDISGKLGHYMPGHAAGLAAIAATATNYLNSIKPKNIQAAPLDTPMAPNKAAEATYDRQVDLAQQPMLVLQHVKDGDLLPQDIKTIQTIYPGLWASIMDKSGEMLINAKDEKKMIPYRQKQSLSLLLGQPLDSTFSVTSMQAIISSQRPQQPPQANGSAKATGIQLKQINKVDEMFQTPLDRRQSGEKD